MDQTQDGYDRGDKKAYIKTVKQNDKHEESRGRQGNGNTHKAKITKAKRGRCWRKRKEENTIR